MSVKWKYDWFLRMLASSFNQPIGDIKKVSLIFKLIVIILLTFLVCVNNNFEKNPHHIFITSISFLFGLETSCWNVLSSNSHLPNDDLLQLSLVEMGTVIWEYLKMKLNWWRDIRWQVISKTETLEALIQMRLKYISIGTCKNKK